MKQKSNILVWLSIVLCVLTIPANAAPQPPQRDITIALPAETVLHSLQSMLPFQFAADSSSMKGIITVRSLDSLKINGNTLSVQGVLEGRDMAMVTKVANQSFRVKLGQVTLPITCDLQTRYEAKTGNLYITPTFPSGSKSGDSSPVSLRPLLKALAGKEYPINLDSLQLANINIGNRNVPITMMPVDISGKDNSLVLRLQPREKAK